MCGASQMMSATIARTPTTVQIMLLGTWPDSSIRDIYPLGEER